MSELEPIDPALDALFDAERRRPGPSAEQRARVRAAVAVTTAVAATAATSAAASSGAVAVGGVSAAPVASATTATGGGVLAALSGAASSVGTAVVAAALATAVGVGLVTTYEPAPEQTVVVDDRREAVAAKDPVTPVVEPPVEDVAPVAVPPAKPKQIVRASPTVTPPAPSSEPQPTTAEARAALLAIERALIADARAALVRGEGDRALQVLEQHRGAHRDGLLAEEREALHVMALAKVGRATEAREEAARFLVTYPQSMFAAGIRAALGASGELN